MNLLSKFKENAKCASEVIEFDVLYIPGVTEDLDNYKATYLPLNINCYGPSKELAIRSARSEAEAHFMEESTMAEAILNAFLKKN